jgi:hypothetical protein
MKPIVARHDASEKSMKWTNEEGLNCGVVQHAIIAMIQLTNVPGQKLQS